MADTRTMSGGDTVDAQSSTIYEGRSQKQLADDTLAVDAVPDQYIKYKMSYKHIGKCLIFNNKNFHPVTGMNKRNGTDVDAAKLSKTFKNLGYDVMVYNDKTCNEMLEILQNAAKSDHSQMASFVCIFLSHGDEGLLYGIDGAEEIRKFTSIFRGDRCRSLVGKPKMFFIQACRGNEFDGGVETDSVVDEKSTSLKKIPIEADFLYAYSTAPDIRSVFLGVDPRKAMGLDGVPGLALRSCADQLAEVFINIFNFSLLQTEVPTCFKEITSIPIPKKAHAMCLNGYCPVALTSIMKCFKRMVMARINSSLPVCPDPLQLAYQCNR